MRAVKKPWSEAALDDLMVEVAEDVKARATAARERLAGDPVERDRVLGILGGNGYGLDDDQALISLSEHGPLLSQGELMRPYEH